METNRILLVVPNVAERASAQTALTNAGESVVAEASSMSELTALFTEHNPEVVLLDETMLPLSEEIRTLLHPTALVILRSPEPDPETIQRITESAAFTTLTKPLRSEEIAAEIALAVTRNQDLMECNSELNKVQTRLADRIVIEKAKGLLIEREGLTEPEAFKQIHFAARRANRTMRTVAEDIIARFADSISEE